MATSEHTTTGIAPAVNDIIAGLVIVAAYVTRFGVITEGTGAWWHVPLFVTTDFLLPLLGGVWLLGVPVWQLYQRLDDSE